MALLGSQGRGAGKWGPFWSSTPRGRWGESRAMEAEEGFWSFHIIPGKMCPKHGVGNHEQTFSGRYSRWLLPGLLQQDVYFLANRHRAFRNYNHVIKKTRTLAGNLALGKARRAQVPSVGGAWTYKPGLLLSFSLTNVHNHNPRPSNSHTHLQACTVDGMEQGWVTPWSREHRLSGTSITLQKSTELRVKAQYHRCSSASSKSSKNISLG